MDIWQSYRGASPAPITLKGPTWIDSRGEHGLGSPQNTSRPHVNLVPTTKQRDVVGVVVIPDQGPTTIFGNNWPLSAGIHALCRRDQVAFQELRLWVGDGRVAMACEFDAKIHGSDVRCARTRALLRPDDQVVVCPGSDCGLIYLAEAWAMQTPCHGCGLDPSAPAWRPPEGNATRSIEALLAIARRNNRAVKNRTA